MRELALAARGSQEAGFTQPRAHLVTDPVNTCKQKNGFALFNGKHKTTINENYEINMGRTDRSKYYQIERWGPGYGEQLYKGKGDIFPQTLDYYFKH